MWPLGLETILNGLLWDMVESFLTLKYTMSYFDNLEIWRFFTCVLTVGYPSWYMYLCVMIVYIWILFFHPDSFIFGHLKLIQCCSRRVCYTLRCLTLQHRMSSVTFSFVFSMRSSFCIAPIQVVCLFYPLYYGGGFIIIVLLTIEALRDREETTNVIGSKDLWMRF